MALSEKESRRRIVGLIQQWEREARANPRRYTAHVIFLAVLGYGYMAVMLLGSLALLVALGVGIVALVSHVRAGVLVLRGLIILAPVILALLWGSLMIFWTFIKVVLRLFFWHMPPPGGMLLQRGMAPRLYQLLEQLQRKMRIPRISGVYLQADLNAGVVQIPTLGMVARHRAYLFIGLPLLYVMNAEQFRAVLAHEFAHLSGEHSRTHIWLTATLETWQQLLESLEEDEGRDFGWLRAFFSWYTPMIGLRLHALQRSQEYAADRIAKQIAGATTCAEQLVTLHLNEIWHTQVLSPAIIKAAEKNPQIAVYATLMHHYAQGIPADAANEMLHALLKEGIDYSDTHPPLAERLSLLGYSPQQPEGDPMRNIPAIPLPTVPEESAASYYLGATAQEAINFLDHAVARAMTEQAGGERRPVSRV